MISITPVRPSVNHIEINNNDNKKRIHDNYAKRFEMKRNRLMCNTVATMVNTKTSFDSVRYFLLAHSYFTE